MSEENNHVHPAMRDALAAHTNGMTVAQKAQATYAKRIRAEALEEAARWHDERARDTPDAFEMELHQVSARTIRAMGIQKEQA